MKKVIYIICSIIAIGTKAQVGINTTTPDKDAILDIQASNKGFNIPTFSLSSRNDTSFLAAPPKESLVMYNTNNSPSLVGGKALYFWSGTKWDFVFNEMNSNLFENLVKYQSAVTNNTYSSNVYTETTYNKGQSLYTTTSPTTTNWTVLNELTQNLEVNRATNDATFIMSGMLQADNESTQQGVYLLTVGIFVDDQLVDVKPIYFNASIPCGYKTIKVIASTRDMTVGIHSIKFAIKNYKRPSTVTTTFPRIYYGSKGSNCTNLSNDEARMSAVVILNQPLVL